MDAPLDPADLDEDEFLAGPGRDAADVVVDDAMAKDLDSILSHARGDASAGGPSASPDPDAPRIPSEVAPGYAYVPVDAGLLLLAPDGTIAGAYLGPDMAVAPAHRGRGLGAELALETAIALDGLPVWDHDKPGYSRAGAAAHRAAHRMGLDRAALDRRRARHGIDPAATPRP